MSDTFFAGPIVPDDLTPVGVQDPASTAPTTAGTGASFLDEIRFSAWELAQRAAVGAAVAGFLVVGMDVMTVRAQAPTACSRDQIAVDAGKVHNWPLTGLPWLASDGPALRDVMAAKRPDLPLTAVLAANPGLQDGPMGNLRRVHGGVTCINVPPRPQSTRG